MTISIYKKTNNEKRDVRIYALYQTGLSLRDVATACGVSHELVRQICKLKVGQTKKRILREKEKI
jgi:transposase